MESTEDDDDLKLVKASAGLLSDLEAALPRLLWKQTEDGSHRRRVHTQVRRRDLDYVVKLIEPFQGEPQLLDARLKHILPPIVEAYIDFLQLSPDARPKTHLDLQSAICIILYTLCKVRGYKVILGFLNNEPRYLEPILTKLEDVLAGEEETHVEWNVPYVLLLWLSHLLLTPFDLASISSQIVPGDGPDQLKLPENLPPLAQRLLRVGLKFLPTSTKAQDAAAMLLVRLVTRPDMQKMRLADHIVSSSIASLEDHAPDAPVTIYEKLGPLRLLAGIAMSAELGYLIPDVYHACEKLTADVNSSVASNAVAKKMMVKTYRNIAILSLHSATAQGSLLSLLETSGVLENVIDYLLRSLGDRDTPVRYAAAKALSRIILELDPEMGHEVIQAILDTFNEDMPRQSEQLDFRTANALKWHGLTLALAHTLFKRSAAPEQLPDIVNALVSALQFEQRTATGSSVGTNVRDAANFAIWSLSRRYTTDELLSVSAAEAGRLMFSDKKQSVIQGLATQLVLSACLDPVGNVRRGSSAALQELIGRHPNQVHEGIPLVQVVDYQAVGLRRRAMVKVAYRAAELGVSYWAALVEGLLAWRGLGSPDVSSREAAAAALARFSASEFDSGCQILQRVKAQLLQSSINEVESLHGLVLSLACLLERMNDFPGDKAASEAPKAGLWEVMDILQRSTKGLSPRTLRSELPSATGRLLAALCNTEVRLESDYASVPFDTLEALADRLFARHEDTIRQTIPAFARSLLALRRKAGVALGGIGPQNLSKKVAVEGSKSTLQGACRAIALGSLAALYEGGLRGDHAKTAVSTLANLTTAMNVDWRIVGVKALQFAVESNGNTIEQHIANYIVDAVHRGLNDYTIDERGDVGSLVRLQAIACASSIFASRSFGGNHELLQPLKANIYRLSLEKLDRVRLDAACCRERYLEQKPANLDLASVSSRLYFDESLSSLMRNEALWKQHALLEGSISCAGISSETLTQASRSALARLLNETTLERLNHLLSIFASILKSLLLDAGNTHPALDLLAFLLDMQIPQRLADSDFKWRNLLSTVQKSHHKSNDIPKILAAVNVYRGLADIKTICDEVLKKLLSMFKTNPYPRVRLSVAETLFVVTGESALKNKDWTRPASKNLFVIEEVQKRYLGS